MRDRHLERRDVRTSVDIWPGAAGDDAAAGDDGADVRTALTEGWPGGTSTTAGAAPLVGEVEAENR